VFSEFNDGNVTQINGSDQYRPIRPDGHPRRTGGGVFRRNGPLCGVASPHHDDNDVEEDDLDRAYTPQLVLFDPPQLQQQ